MKKKQLSLKLMLGKKTITPLSNMEHTKGGDTGPSLYPTETPSCRTDCRNTVVNCRTIGAFQTNCCPTWQPICDSVLVSCLG